MLELVEVFHASHLRNKISLQREHVQLFKVADVLDDLDFVFGEVQFAQVDEGVDVFDLSDPIVAHVEDF